MGPVILLKIRRLSTGISDKFRLQHRKTATNFLGPCALP